MAGLQVTDENIKYIDEKSKTRKMTGIDAREEFRELFKIIAEKLSTDEAYVTHQHIW